ncbi:MAG: HAD hydrolase family protein [Acidobacteria bacterium]|nr:HAD hydrolase family protein [Acidobacteriota bacterium]
MKQADKENLIIRAKSIKLILMDCDGVLTDGKIILLPCGEEIKNFHVLDGQGISLAKNAGLKIGVISGRRSKVLTSRCEELKIDFLLDKIDNKLSAYNNLINQLNLNNSQVAFIGDDLPDLPVMQKVGLAIAVKTSVKELKAVANLVTKRKGGKGAVREAIEFILKAQGNWEKTIAKYL